MKPVGLTHVAYIIKTLHKKYFFVRDFLMSLIKNNGLMLKIIYINNVLTTLLIIS